MKPWEELDAAVSREELATLRAQRDELLAAAKVGFNALLYGDHPFYYDDLEELPNGGFESRSGIPKTAQEWLREAIASVEKAQ